MFLRPESLPYLRTFFGDRFVAGDDRGGAGVAALTYDANGNVVQSTDGRGKIQQGMLEGSNVNVVEEMVDMIECQRAYEVNSKMINAVDEMLKNANQML